jgi:hypothetical protein
MKPKVGDKVKFKDELWEEKKAIAQMGGLFGPPISLINPVNEFTINMVNNQGDENGNDDFELGLDGFPWLVYFDEMEIIN